MIIVKLMGGLGNQMFQYSAARRLAHKRNTDVRLDLREYKSQNPQNTPRLYELDCYNIQASVATENYISIIQGVGTTKPLFTKLGIKKVVTQINEQTMQLQKNVLTAPNKTYLVGYWQNEKYFNDIREILLKEFVPKSPINDTNKLILDEIQSSNSVSIHVRRGDYITNPNAKVFHGLSTIEYYKASIKYLKGKTNNPRFFVFSDDIKWCKNNLNLEKDAIFVDGNSGELAYEDIRLMSNCKHNIIANSSFSWWGAWLNNNEDKTVIAPRIWFLDKKANQETEVVPSSWIRL